jgi:hypothetical protein
MALTSANSAVANAPLTVTTPCLVSAFQTVATNLVQDAAAITNPTTQIGGTGARTILSGGVGTHLIPMLKVLATDADASDVVHEWFGRHSPSDPWVRLATVDGNTSSTLVKADATDITDGTHQYIVALPAKWIVRAGFREVVPGITTAYDGAGVASAALLVKEV